VTEEVWRYSGDALQAARLLAARTTAGFATAVDAAQRFGWSVARFRSHEGASRGISDSALREYAQAFAVSEDWLRDGTIGPFPPFRDKHIQVDPVRVEELELRLETQRRPADVADANRGRRLRLARRLAGFRSAASGGAAAGVHRSTINAHERAIDGFDISSARNYARAFGCEPEWLLEGSLPSGYPHSIESMLDRYLLDHELDERHAAARLPAYSPPPTSAITAPISEARAIPVKIGEEMPEFEVLGLARLVTGASPKDPPISLPGWSMPKAFLEGILRAEPRGCVMVAVPKRTRTGGFPSAPGDRLIIDTSVVEVFSAVYAVVSDDMLMIADARNDEGRRLAMKAAHRLDGAVLLGQVVGTVCALR
jgi:hypothetical protein